MSRNPLGKCRSRGAARSGLKRRRLPPPQRRGAEAAPAAAPAGPAAPLGRQARGRSGGAQQEPFSAPCGEVKAQACPADLPLHAATASGGGPRRSPWAPPPAGPGGGPPAAWAWARPASAPSKTPAARARAGRCTTDVRREKPHNICKLLKPYRNLPAWRQCACRLWSKNGAGAAVRQRRGHQGLASGQPRCAHSDMPPRT